MRLENKNRKNDIFWTFKAVGFFVISILLFFLANTNSAHASLFGYTRKAEIVLDQSSANLTDFPVFLTEVNLPSEMFDADGSYPALNGGGDVKFSSDSAGANQLPCEIVSFVTNNNPALGTAEIWVKTNLSGSATTSIWVWYGKAGDTQPAVTADYGRNNVWDTDFKMVQHLKDATTSTTTDSTSNANNGVKLTANEPIEATGKIGKGQQFDGSNDYLNVKSGAVLSEKTAFTIDSWVYFANGSAGFVIYSQENTSSNNQLWFLRTLNTRYLRYDFKDINGANEITSDSTSTINNDAWNHIVLTYDGTYLRYYINGSLDKTITQTISGTYTTNTSDISSLRRLTPVYYTSTIDEIRLSSLARSGDFIATSYSNQNDPANFALEQAPETNPEAIEIDETTDSLRDRRVIAYDTNEEGSISLTGYFTGTAPAHIEVQVFNRTTSATVQVNGNDWNTVGSEVIGSNTWSGTLSNIPKTNAWLGIRVRKSDATSVTSDMTHKIGVGYVVIYTGQSYIDKWLDYSPYTPVTLETSDDLVSKFRHTRTGQRDESAHNVDVNYTGWALNTGDGSVIFANKLRQELGCPIGILDYGMGGSALLEVNKGLTYGYWIGSSAVDNWLEDLAEGLLVSEPMSRVKANSLLWYQGYTDAVADVSYTNYFNGLGTLFSSFRTYASFPNLPIFTVGLPRATNTTGNDVGFSNVREAQINKANDTNNYFAGQSIDLELYSGDYVHLTETSQETEALRYAQSILWHELNTGNFTYHRGPRNVGWSVVDSTHTDVLIEHDGGTDFTPTSNVDSYQVYNGSSWITATGARQNATTVRLTHASGTISDVRCLYGRSPSITNILKDNSPLALPVEKIDSIHQGIYTVTFNKNTGDTEASPTTKTAGYNTTIDALPTAPTKTGYTFASWNTQSDGNGTTFTDATNVTADITVYAIWTLNQHILTYSASANGSISGTTPQTINHGADGTAVTAVPDANYHFTTWSDSSIDNPRTDINVTGDISVSASFAIDTYTVSFQNYDTTELKSETVNYGGSATAPADPTRTGYTFTGWDIAYNNVTTDLTVTAEYSIDTYTITYNGNDNTEGTVPADQTKTYAVDLTLQTNSGTLVKTNYTFAGWNTQADGGGTDYAEGATYTTNTALTLYAKWTAEEFTLTYSANANGSLTGTTSQTVSYGGSGSAVTAVPADNYHFTTWSDSSIDNPRTDTNVTGDISVSASFASDDIITHTLIYSAGSNGIISGDLSQIINDGEDGTQVEAVADSGYHFVDWNDNSTQNPRTDTNVAGDISVVANFAIDTTDEDEEDSSSTDELDISNIKYTATDTTITISWKTNNSADSKVKYGKSKDGLDDKKVDNEKEKKHKIILKNLTPETKYFFKIYSEDENDSDDSSRIYSIATDKTQRANSSSINSDDKSTSEEDENENQDLENSIQEQKNKNIITEIKFRIADSQDKPIPGIPVTIHSEPQSAITDKDGIVVFRNIEIGTHTLTFNYQNQDFQKNIEIAESKTDNNIIEIRAINEKNIKKSSLNWKLIVFGILGLISIVLLWFGWRKRLWRNLK
ncbi:MAG: InlB B-repeat-containing protein [Parcubacteria group bacterium]|jgi:uncharacterized repeat protein (TIGR02543 family)